MFKGKINYIIIFVLVFLIYLLTSAGNTPYNYFIRLADAFIHGRYWLTENPPWLSELIPAGLNKYYVVYPPMPAILSIPFVFLFGKNLPQQYIAHLLGAGLVILTIALSWKIKRDKMLALWSGILIGLGSIIWFLSSVGSAWYMGQISAAFFLTAAIYESLSKKRALLIGIFLGVAYLSRIQLVLTLPFFLYQIKGKCLNEYLKFILGVTPFVIFNAVYNYLRFGVPWDKAYYLIPGLLNEPWFSKGLFNISYIPNNLKVIFLSLPIFKKEFPYIQPSWEGLAIWITTPAFIYSIYASIKERIVLLSWFTILLISLVIFSHGTTGFAQFGYRFAVDFYPFLMLLTIKGVAKTGLKWQHWLLLVIGVVVNLWGILWINKFGWVSY
ncbi:hypothetical protein A2W13_01475 [Candidatus Woesebacteria bacterium RBG_16_36_11]|uniref:Glycosyltransferase RgtA/B/C/D-like domain-containing protein n=3 Tax=Candidatus Woeseibacteriota TaxID=1752722 RepID=A0A1F7XB95_9BACT|nr:MAG: hypothetical protein A2Z67_03485 [Candidatus Woesebacteria bacterium RBG_13_36_22]OGM12297.1 MAG: hypothetical protein A2W13_01475 [Candidatus Woesebacteria bacterium RBG_16_36_11]OGM16673.1 MAG: hypothetical protein A2V55_01000 [Candidatus Woesebacteria bacterium RBG_19FT_COMBO_37_29]